MGFLQVTLLALLLLLVYLTEASSDLQEGPAGKRELRRAATAAPPSGSESLLRQLSLANAAAVAASSASASAPSEGGGGGREEAMAATAASKNNSLTNITAQLGASVFLPCKTHHSMERQVSWLRRRDWHILTSGTLAYTKEERFAVHHTEGSAQWTLAIRYLTLDDAGTYECQISTGGGIVSHLVNLRVVVPRAVIPGKGEYHIESGSTISLVCFIEQSPEAPQYVFWYHDARMINYDRERGGVEVRLDAAGPRVSSRLTVGDARPSDSGNYTCAAANAAPASVVVYITHANQIAAVQPRAVDAGTSSSASVSSVLAGAVILLANLVIHH